MLKKFSLFNIYKIGIKKLIMLVGTLIIVFFIGVTISNYMSKPVIKGEYISGKLKDVSDLTTAELSYRGIITYEDGSIPFITKKSFFMIYNGKVKASVDVSKIETKITDKKVVLTVPKVDDVDVIIDPESIKFYDREKALFNWEDKEDGLEAIKYAKKDIIKNSVGIDKIKKKAEVNAEKILKKLLEDVVGKREIIIEFVNK